MNWLLLVRLADIMAICLSCGMLLAIAVRALESRRSPAHALGLSLSYLLFAFGTALEIQYAIEEDLPFTWRTVSVTIAAAVGVATTGWAYFVWGQGGLVRGER